MIDLDKYTYKVLVKDTAEASKLASYLESEGFVNVGIEKDFEKYVEVSKKACAASSPLNIPLIPSIVIAKNYRDEDRSFKFCDMPANLIKSTDSYTLPVKQVSLVEFFS